MGRRTTVFEDVAKLPWPIGIVLAGIVFVGLQVLQATDSSNDIIEAIKPAAKIPAYFFIAMFLFSSLVSLIGQMKTRRQYVATQSIAEIRSLSWQQFESFVGERFRDQGYFVVETPVGPDGGVDLVLRKDGEKTYVQCKQWKTNQVGVEKIRELLGSMAAGGAQHGIFVTSGTYTKPAKKLAFECGIELIDGNKLARLRGEEPEPMVCLTPHLEAAQAAPSCPKCGSEMVERTATQGANKGNSFWGCSTFPKCRGIRNF